MSFTIHTGSCYPASALEVLRNALYKFKTYLLTYLPYFAFRLNVTSLPQSVLDTVHFFSFSSNPINVRG